MDKEKIEVGKEYNFKMFNEVVTVNKINDDGTVNVTTKFGTVMATWPKNLEELEK